MLATACAAAGVFGAIRCQTLIGASATELVRAHGHVAAAAPLARGCDYVLTTASTGFGRFFGDGMVIGGVQQVERLDDVLRVAESAGLQAEVAFLLERPWFGTPLHDRLQSLAVPVSGDQVLVYRFKVPR